MRNKIRIVLLLSFLMNIAVSTQLFAFEQAPLNDKEFYQLADDYFDHVYFPINPTIATQLGIHQYDNQIEHYSLAGINSDIDKLKDFEKKLTAYSTTKLSETAQADYELILNNIRGELLKLQTIKYWQTNPDVYSSGVTNSIFVIMERSYATPEVRLTALIAREKMIPGILQNARDNLKNPPKVFTEISLEQLPGIIKFFKQDVPAAFPSIPNNELKKQFLEINEKVVNALNDYQRWLTTTLLPKSHGDFRIGEASYRKKLEYDEMVTLPLSQLLEIGMKNLHDNQREFNRLAKKIYPGKTHQQILEEIQASHPAANEILSVFNATFNDLIQFIKTKHIITIPSDVRPIMQPTPPFLEATTIASMDTPGPFEQSKEAYFNVTLPNSTWSQEKQNNFLKIFNDSDINITAIHEAYPGHYVQFLWMSKIHDKVRKILGANTNSEGWAHYCEQMILDEGFGKGIKSDIELDKQRMGQLLLALLRNARFIVGIKMHTGKMSFNQGIKFFIEEGYQTPMGALLETKRGTADPTYLYYTLGKLQILKLRHDLQQKEKNHFSLQRFHDDFMQQGSPPIKIVRKALLHDDSDTL